MFRFVKKTKSPFCFFLIFIIVFQSFPLEAGAFSILEGLAKLLMGVNLPDEIRLTDTADLKVGNTPLFKCVFKADANGDGKKECVNPFSTIRLGSDQTELKDETGRLKILQPRIPEICELKIPSPPEQELLSKEEKTALMKACFDLRRIQTAAANEAYFAKNIFNNTDPLSNCLFLRNCKSSCYLRFGDVTFTISVFDILTSVFGPAGWIMTLQKIARFAAKVVEVKNIITRIQNTIKSGVTALNDLFKTMAQLSTLYDSLSKIFDIVSEDGLRGFEELLGRYSDNLFKFSQAKSEAQTIISDAQKESLSLISELENEKGVKFIFGEDAESRAKKNDLEKLINEYVSRFPSAGQVISILQEDTGFLAEFLDENGDMKKSGETECPEGRIDNCFAASSTLPADCSIASIENENVFLSCQERAGKVSCEENDFPKYSFDFPGGTERTFTCRKSGIKRMPDLPGYSGSCFLNCGKCGLSCLAERECDVQWDTSADSGGFFCPAKTIGIPFPQTFGKHQVSGEAVPGEIEVVCPATCQVGCQEPVNNWLENFKTVYGLTSKLQKLASEYRGHSDFEEIRKVLPNIRLARDLVSASRQFAPSAAGEKYYWTTSAHPVNVKSLEEAEKWGEENCSYAADLAYFDWDDKIKTLQLIDFDLMAGALDFVDWLIHNDRALYFQIVPRGFLYSTSPLDVTVFSIPLLAWQMEKINNDLTGLARKPESQAASAAISQLKGKIGQLKNKLSDLNKVWFNSQKNSPKDFVAVIISVKILSQSMASIVSESEIIYSGIVNSLGSSPELNNVNQALFLDLKPRVNNFLRDLADFEREKTFEQIKDFLAAIEGLEKAIGDLNEVKIRVSNIKPTLEIAALQIKQGPDGAMDFSEQGIDSFETFKDKLLQNPLSYLDGVFNEIEGFLAEDGNIGTALKNIEDNPLFGENAKKEAEKIWGKRNSAYKTIFGDEEIRPACRAINSLLQSNPEETDAACQNADFQLLNDNNLKNNCQKREELIEFIDNTGLSIEEYYQRLKSGKIAFPAQWWIDNVCRKIDMLRKPADFSKCLQYADSLTASVTLKKIEDLSKEELKNKCNELESQESLKSQCDRFALLKKALRNDYDCFLSSDCRYIRTTFNRLIPYCPSWQGQIPYMLKDDDAAVSGFQNKNLDEAKNVCLTNASDLKTPLEEVMDVYSILLAIKSYSGFKNGVKTSYEDAKRAYQAASSTIAMIKNLFKEQEADMNAQSGISVGFPKCVSGPATGWKGQTSASGGPVCPEIKNLFSVVESEFAIIRENLQHIDMVRRKKEWLEISAGDFRASVVATYPVEYPAVNPILDLAKEIKKRSQNLWAIATALNFAAENCVCGQSFCKFPLCVSGIPLTLYPLTEPYCYLVFILRHPLLKQIETLENYIK